MTTSIHSAMSAEAAITESINRLRDDITYYAQNHLSLQTPLDLQALANWARLDMAAPEETTLTTISLDGSAGCTYMLPSVPEAVIQHIRCVLQGFSEIKRKAFLLFSMAHFRLWQADENIRRSDYLRVLSCFESAIFNLTQGMHILEIEWGDHSLVKSHIARMGARARLENDPKQADKLFVFGCWQEWAQDPKRYRSKAAFARDMLCKCEHLESHKVIEGWCRDWENG